MLRKVAAVILAVSILLLSTGSAREIGDAERILSYIRYALYGGVTKREIEREMFDYLDKRYGEKFCKEDRANNPIFPGVYSSFFRLYVYPENNPDVGFVVSKDKESGEIYDNYAYNIMRSEVDMRINDIVGKYFEDYEIIIKYSLGNYEGNIFEEYVIGDAFDALVEDGILGDFFIRIYISTEEENEDAIKRCAGEIFQKCESELIEDYKRPIIYFESIFSEYYDDFDTTMITSGSFNNDWLNCRYSFHDTLDDYNKVEKGKKKND